MEADTIADGGAEDTEEVSGQPLTESSRVSS